MDSAPLTPRVDDPSCGGICIPDEFMALKKPSLEAKIIYLIIKRELETKRKHFTTALTDPRLSEMLAISPSTVQRKLKELEKSGYIAIVSQNRATEKDAKGISKEIRGIRWIYLDKKLAGHRRRAINKSKRPMEYAYARLVLEEGMSSEAYVRAMKNQAAEDRRREEDEETQRYLEAFKESLADVADDMLADLEKESGEKPGTYLKMKRQYLAEQEAFATMDAGDDGDDGDDGLFDDLDDD